MTHEELLIPRVMCVGTEPVYHVYVLIDPVIMDIRYVGCTKKKLNDRLRGHCSNDSRNKINDKKYKWIMGLLDSGVRPIIKSISTHKSKIDAVLAEEKLTRGLINTGANLYNIKFGERFPQFMKDDISKRQIGKVPPNASLAASEKRKRSVIQLTIDGQFVKKWDMIKDAVLGLKTYSSDIAKCCTGRQRHAAGFRWMYTSEYEEYLKQKEG